MAQEPVIQKETGFRLLGPILCWAVVFADIGSSVYYVPGLFYRTAHSLAGFFVLLIMPVFVLLALKYAEVTHRFPQGGGAVNVAAQGLNRWFGALAGMFLLVSYFFTAAISSFSAVKYLSIVIPAIDQPFSALSLAITFLVLLGILNWIGAIKDIARVILIAAIIAFASDLAILFTVFTHISFSYLLSLLPTLFKNQPVTPFFTLTGFAGAFLAISGLESISQLSPVMKSPRKKAAGIALLLIIVTVALTSPLLIMSSVLLLPHAAADPALSTQLISRLGGHWGNTFLQTEVAISASALLILAGNTAILGADFVFVALARLESLPNFLLRRNRLRGTRHYSIALATGVPIIVLMLVFGNINVLGDMYVFGLLGAFLLTGLGLDIVRWRERKAVSVRAGHMSFLSNLWYRIDFWLGILTTVLVALAWFTNLITKPLSTGFGSAVVTLGMTITYINYRRIAKVSARPIITTSVGESLPDSVLAILTADNDHNNAIIRAAIRTAINPTDRKKPVIFLYISKSVAPQAAPRMFEVYDPYLQDTQSLMYFKKIEGLTKEPFVRRYVYLLEEPDTIARTWRQAQSREVVIATENEALIEDIRPDNIWYELTPEGKVAHLLWKST